MSLARIALPFAACLLAASASASAFASTFAGAGEHGASARVLHITPHTAR